MTSATSLASPRAVSPSATCESGPRALAVVTRQRAIAAIRAFLSSHVTAIGTLTSATFEISTFAQAEKLATMLAMQYPNPDRAALGIWELLANAIEHGSLGIGFAEKGALLRHGEYDAEVRRRLADPVLSRRAVRVAFRRSHAALTLTVTDDGAGFDHTGFSALGEDVRAPNGRGIRIARDLSFDTVRYVGAGNRVVARTRRTPVTGGSALPPGGEETR